MKNGVAIRMAIMYLLKDLKFKMMRISKKKKIMIVEIEESDEKLVLEKKINKLCQEKNNLIISLSNNNKELNKPFFEILLKKQTANNKSFVLVSKEHKIDYELNVVPTLTEAIDFIEIEEVERQINEKLKLKFFGVILLHQEKIHFLHRKF